MFPDFYHAKINGQPATAVIKDENWLKTEFVTTVAQRGTSVLNARKAGSAASAANAAIDSVQSVIGPRPPGIGTASASVPTAVTELRRADLFLPRPQRRPETANRARPGTERIHQGKITLPSTN
jgi:malate/lactate dehydrogenase